MVIDECNDSPEDEIIKYKTASNFNRMPKDDLTYSTDPSLMPPTTIKT